MLIRWTHLLTWVLVAVVAQVALVAHLPEIAVTATVILQDLLLRVILMAGTILR